MSGPPTAPAAMPTTMARIFDTAQHYRQLLRIAASTRPKLSSITRHAIASGPVIGRSALRTKHASLLRLVHSLRTQTDAHLRATATTPADVGCDGRRQVRRYMFFDQIWRAVPIQGGQTERIVRTERFWRAGRFERDRNGPAFREEQRGEAVPHFVLLADLKAVEGDAIHRGYRRDM